MHLGAEKNNSVRQDHHSEEAHVTHVIGANSSQAIGFYYWKNKSSEFATGHFPKRRPENRK